MNLTILEDIGLTKAEIKVFMSLLESGSSYAGDIVEKSGLHNAVVHRAFHSLKEKGLLTYIYVGKTKKYQPIEPQLLLSFLDEKKNRLEELLPDLEEKQQLAKEKTIGRMFEGLKGLKELLTLMIETDSKHYAAYGGPAEGQEVLGDLFWSAFHNNRIRKGIRARLIFQSNLRYWANELNKRKLTTVKLTDQQFEGVTETIVCGKRVAVIIYSEKPLGFLIEDEKVVESYQHFFEILWKNS